MYNILFCVDEVLAQRVSDVNHPSSGAQLKCTAIKKNPKHVEQKPHQKKKNNIVLYNQLD
jgi:hypothetical protein